MKRFLFLTVCLLGTLLWGGRVQAQCANGNYNCFIHIVGEDSYGDGWNGNSITFVQGETTIGTFTLEDGPSGEATIRVCTDNGPIACVWTTGMYGYEASFTITDSLGSVLYQGNGSDLYGVFANIDPCPTCPAPSIPQVSDVTDHSATIGWTEVGNATEWRYYCGTSMTPTDNDWVAVTDNPMVTVTGLEGNTEYVFMVYSYCGEGDISTMVSTTFRTDCAPNTTLPLVEDFESNGYDMPFCWRIWETATVSSGYYGSTYPYVMQAYASGYGQVSGTGAIELNSGNGDVSFISPRIPLPVNQVEVGFWLATNTPIQVGYTFSNDPANAVFHPVHTVNVGLVNENTYPYVYNHEYVVLTFDTVTSEDTAYIVFRKTAPYTNDIAYIDDITIRLYNPCLVPEGLHVTASGEGTVSLAWNGDENGIYEVVYGPEGFDPDEEEENVLETEGLTAVVEGLDDVVYQFYVRRVCSTGNGYWAMPVKAIPNMVLMPAEDTLTITGCGFNIVDNGGLEGDYSENAEQMLVIMPEEGMTVHLTGSYNLGEYISFAVYAGIGTEGLLLTSVSTNYNEAVGDIDVMSQIGPMTIVLESEYYGGDGFVLHVECVELPSCINPYDLAVSNITGNSATLTWSYPDDMTPDAYIIILNRGQEGEQEIEIEDGTSLSYQLTNLGERTAYTVDLMAVCGGDPSDTISTGFVTMCLSGGELEIGAGTGTNYYIPTYIYYGNTLSQQIFLNSELDGDTVIYGVTFDVASGSGSTRQIDVYMDTTSITSYEEAAYVPQSADKRYFTGSVTFSDGPVEIGFDHPFAIPAGKNILLTVNDHTNSYTSSHNFKVSNTTSQMAIYSYRDNNPFNPLTDAAYSTLEVRNNVVFMVDCSNGATCVRPNVTDIIPTSNSIAVTWTPGSEETAWMVEYAESGNTEYAVAVASTGNTTYTITDLTPQTTYNIRITSLCGETTAFRIVTATTLCGAASVPLVEDFTNFTGSSWEPYFEPCWDRKDNDNYSYYPYYDYDYYDQTIAYLYFGGYEGTLVVPTLAAPLDSLTVSFDIECSYNYGYDLRMEFGIVSYFGSANEVYIPLDTFEVAEDMVGEWINFVTDIDSYDAVTASTTGRLYFRSIADEYTSLYFDNLNITRIGSCRVPANVQLTGITPTTATFTVTDGRNVEGTSYTLYYGTSKFFAMAEDSIAFNANSVTISGLNAGTRYWAWIKSNCSETDESRVVPINMFITECMPVVVTDANHYLYDFDNSETDACMNNLVGRWETYMSQYADAAYSGGYSLYAAEYDTINNVATVEFPEFDFSNLPNGAEFTFYQRLPNMPDTYTNTVEILYRTTGSEWTVAETFGATGSNWVRRYVSLPASANADEYHVALRYTTDTVEEYEGTTFLRIDNIEVRPVPECFRPLDIALLDVDNRTAIVGWNGQSDEYRVQYRAVGDWSWNTVITEADTAILTGLVMNSNYEVRVRGNQSQLCEWSDVLRFTTTMCVDREEGYNFDEEASASTTDVAPFDNSDYYSYSEVIVTAEQLGDISTINGFAFNVSNPDAGNTMDNCQVYIGTTTLNALTEFQFGDGFQLVYDGTLSFETEGWQTFTLQSPYVWDGQSNIIVAVMAYNSTYNYYGMQSEFYSHQAPANRVMAGSSSNEFTPATANTLPLYAKQASSNVPDYYFVGCNPVCYEPVVTSQQTTPQSITLGFLDEGYLYELQIKEHTAANWNDPVYVQDTNRYTFNQLDNMTAYDIRLRHDCTEASIGMTDWVELTIVTDTACSVPTGLAVSEVGASSATFTWTPGQMENIWDVHVWNDNFSRVYPATTTTLTVTGLPLDETFYAAVRARCGYNNHNVGDYGEEIVFNNICGPVTNVTASNNQGTVTLQWTAGSANTSWVVSYGYAGFDLNQQLGYVTVNTSTAVIQNLPYGHNYGFRVRAICGDGWNSAWTANEVRVNYGGVGIDGVDNATIAVYPNPATDVATICLTGVEGEVTMTIVSVEGRIVRTERFNCGADCVKTTDISGLAAGAYFVRLQAAEWNSVQKLVVK